MSKQSGKTAKIDFKSLYLLSKGIIQAFIKQKSKFTYEEIENEIKKRDGIMRVGPCVTIQDYLDQLEEFGVIILKISGNDLYYSV